eukprot:1918436-Pleurochrysis_carterae.AAC.2
MRRSSRGRGRAEAISAHFARRLDKLVIDLAQYCANRRIVVDECDGTRRRSTLRCKHLSPGRAGSDEGFNACFGEQADEQGKDRARAGRVGIADCRKNGSKDGCALLEAPR